MVNFSPLAAEIVSLVWGSPANFNGFRILAALLHGTLIVGVSQTASLNRERHLCSVGRPSRWALAHISSFFFILHQICVFYLDMPKRFFLRHSGRLHLLVDCFEQVLALSTFMLSLIQGSVWRCRWFKATVWWSTGKECRKTGISSDLVRLSSVFLFVDCWNSSLRKYSCLTILSQS